MSDAMRAETIQIAGHNGDQIEAYLAQPLDAGSRGGVVVIHHMPGYDAASKEIVRRFATMGYLAICPNLHYREAPGASPDDAAAATRAAGGVPDERLVGDVGSAAQYLRELASSNGKVGVIGYCSGGRQSVLAATSLPLDAAVRAQPGWGATAPRERGEILRRAYEILIARQEDLALLMTLEMGKPIAESRGEIAYAAEFFRWFSEEAVRIEGSYSISPDGKNRVTG